MNISAPEPAPLPLLPPPPGQDLRPHLESAGRAGLPITFAGHSLGGSLSKLMMAQAALQLRTACPPRAMSCYTYGSPAVLAHDRGGGCQKVPALLGVPQRQCANFVLEVCGV